MVLGRAVARCRRGVRASPPRHAGDPDRRAIRPSRCGLPTPARPTATTWRAPPTATRPWAYFFWCGRIHQHGMLLDRSGEIGKGTELPGRGRVLAQAVMDEPEQLPHRGCVGICVTQRTQDAGGVALRARRSPLPRRGRAPGWRDSLPCPRAGGAPRTLPWIAAGGAGSPAPCARFCLSTTIAPRSGPRRTLRSAGRAAAVGAASGSSFRRYGGLDTGSRCAWGCGRRCCATSACSLRGADPARTRSVNQDDPGHRCAVRSPRRARALPMTRASDARWFGLPRASGRPRPPLPRVCRDARPSVLRWTPSGSAPSGGTTCRRTTGRRAPGARAAR